MADRIAVAGDVSVLPRAACRGATGWKPLTQQRPHGLERRLVIGDHIELGAIAGGEEDAATGTRLNDACQCARHLMRAMRKPLAHIERRGAVVHPHDLDPHLCMTRHRNRSAPGCVNFSATYISRTAQKPAMLAKAARRPAQWRTTRTQTAQPRTTQVKIPHTICALATCKPPENCAP